MQQWPFSQVQSHKVNYLFIFEDEELRHQVVTLLKKQERRARQRADAISSSNIRDGEVKVPGVKKIPAGHSLSNASVGEEKDRRRKKHDR